VIARLAKRPDGICEMWLFLRVDGIGEFEVSGGCGGHSRAMLNSCLEPVLESQAKIHVLCIFMFSASSVHQYPNSKTLVL